MQATDQLQLKHAPDAAVLPQKVRDELLDMYHLFIEEHGKIVTGTDVLKPNNRALLDDSSLVYVLLQNEIIGFTVYSITDVGSVTLQVVYVRVHHRVVGVGSALVGELVRLYPERRIVADVFRRNRPAVRLFTKHYFTFDYCGLWGDAVRDL